MVHPQALVEPMGLPLRPNPQKKRKTNGMKFSNRDNITRYNPTIVTSAKISTSSVEIFLANRPSSNDSDV
jgi:hypothetical protein